MRIAKSARILLIDLLTGLPIGVLLFILLDAFGPIGVLGAVLAPVIFFAVDFGVNGLDLWLRRVSRDPIWLMTDEGRAWLAERNDAPPSEIRTG